MGGLISVQVLAFVFPNMFLYTLVWRRSAMRFHYRTSSRDCLCSIFVFEMNLERFVFKKKPPLFGFLLVSWGMGSTNLCLC